MATAKKSTKAKTPSPKQIAAAQHKPLVITLTIEDPAAIVQQGMMVLKRGDNAMVFSPRWSNPTQLGDAIREATHQFLQVEVDPAAAKKQAALVKPPPPPAPESSTDNDIPQLKMSVAARIAARVINR
jgi:hypothetical protein